MSDPMSDAIVDTTLKLNALRAENERLRKALERIAEMKMVAGSDTYANVIASAALSPETEGKGPTPEPRSDAS